MNPADVLLITQILGLAAQAATMIPQIRQAWTSPSAATTAEQQANTQAQLEQAHTNLQSVIDTAKKALAMPIATPVLPTAAPAA